MDDSPPPRPDAPKDASKSPKDASKSPKDAPKSPKDAPKSEESPGLDADASSKGTTTTGELERLPTQTLTNPSPSSPLPNFPTHRGPGSPFAGLLAEANAPRARFGGSAAPDPKSSPVPPHEARNLPSARPVGHPTIPLGHRADLAQALNTVGSGTPSTTPGERRIGPYRILEELGTGGMAVVHKAVQPSLDRVVAIKELRAEYVHDRQIAARFAREAASLATLQHGNIITIFDYIYDYESAHIVMEYVEGIDLFDLLATTERLPSDVAAIIAMQVADGLEYAHYRGIVHRDIKPSNILVSKKGEVKVMDFGIARDPGNSELTQVGIAVGTPAYMAPEQIRGDRIDSRTDIFALGIVLYEMLSGEKPWPEEEGRSVTVKVLDEDHRPIRELIDDVPPELERIVLRCLQKDPEDRYKTTHELRRELEIYVHRTVSMDPRGRLVLFLRNRDLITEGEATTFLQPELLQDAGIRRIDQGIPLPPASDLLRPAGIAGSIGLAVVLTAAALSAFVPYGDRLPGEPPKIVIEGALAAKESSSLPSKLRAPDAAAEQGEPGAAKAGSAGAAAREQRLLLGDEGFVRVVVEPWARVFVDGEFYDLTPFAAPIALPPGQHRIAFRNPYFKSVDRYVDVATAKTEILKVSLLPRDELEETQDEQR